MNPKTTKDGAKDSFHPIHDNDTHYAEIGQQIGIDHLVQQIKETADKLVRDHATRGDVKLLSTALRELRYCFKVFSIYHDHPKVTVFGSARLPLDHPSCQQAIEFGRRMAAAGYMVITGAAQGIMEAGHVGAGRDMSIGVNIMLPFEQSANPIITGDAKLMNLKYFFTRKLLFVKECEAVALFPGGFGTQDEGFEVLTLVQTGKSHMFPIVMVDEPGGDYWKQWDGFIRNSLLSRSLISPADTALYKVTDSVDAAVAEVVNFYRVYHSMRYVKGELVLRLQRSLSAGLLERVRTEFGDIVEHGTIEPTAALPEEANETALLRLPRLRFWFDRRSLGRLRMMIDLINREG
ncbi:MAG: LOG family protein [Gemmataceae bacterium]